MRKFKHKITRDEVKTYSEDYYISAETACIPKRFIENSNDWEEIIEREYEILSFRHNLGGGIVKPQNCNKTIEGYLNHESFKINSVKRLSDGEVFSIGDILDFNEKGDGILIRIDFERAPADKGTRRLCFVNDNQLLGDWWDIKELHKAKESLLTTEDGVKLFETTRVWTVVKESLSLITSEPVEYCMHHLYFSEKENAEKYIRLNSPKYSIKDIVSIVNNWSMCGIDENDILNFLAKKQ